MSISLRVGVATFVLLTYLTLAISVAVVAHLHPENILLKRWTTGLCLCAAPLALVVDRAWKRAKAA